MSDVSCISLILTATYKNSIQHYRSVKHPYNHVLMVNSTKFFVLTKMCCFPSVVKFRDLDSYFPAL